MRKFIFCAIALVAFSSVHLSQVTYGGMQQLGLNFSQNGYNTAFNFVNGVRFSRFFTGIGADVHFKNKHNYGRDYFNTSAVYFDGRYYFNKQKTFFSKADAGVNFINDMIQQTPWIEYQSQTGYYGAVGIGFKARIGKELFYSFDVSYCMRQTRYLQSLNGFGHFISSSIPYEPTTEKVDFRRNSIMVSLGLEIF